MTFLLRAALVIGVLSYLALTAHRSGSGGRGAQALGIRGGGCAVSLPAALDVVPPRPASGPCAPCWPGA